MSEIGVDLDLWLKQRLHPDTWSKLQLIYQETAGNPCYERMEEYYRAEDNEALERLLDDPTFPSSGMLRGFVQGLLAEKEDPMLAEITLEWLANDQHAECDQLLHEIMDDLKMHKEDPVCKEATRHAFEYLVPAEVLATRAADMLYSMYGEEQRFEEAYELGGRMLDTFGKNDEPWFMAKHAACCQLAGYLDDAGEWIHKVLDRHPNYGHFWFLAGSIELERGNWSDALELLETGCRKGTEMWPIATAILREVYAFAQKDHPSSGVKYTVERGLRKLVYIVSRKPGVDPASRHDVICIYARMKMFRQAVCQLRRLMKQDGAPQAARNNLAYCLTHLGRLEDADNLIQELLLIDDSRTEYWDTDGLVAWKRGDYSRAEKSFERSLAIDPFHQEAKEHLEGLRQEITIQRESKLQEGETAS